MIIKKVTVSHSCKLAIPNAKFGMAEFFSCREAELEPGENPGMVVDHLTMACRSDVVRAFSRSGIPYVTAYGDSATDISSTDPNYVRIGQEATFCRKISISLGEQRAKVGLPPTVEPPPPTTEPTTPPEPPCGGRVLASLPEQPSAEDNPFGR